MDIPAHHLSTINSIQKLFTKLEEDISRFKAATNLGCKNGCGRCCENPVVFVTVLEVLPLAYELWKSGQAQKILENIQIDHKKWCIFYQQDPLNPGNGRCGVYTLRPLVCRLFGFSVQNNKYGRPQLVTCQTMKSHCAAEYENTAQRLDDETLKAPNMQDYAMAMYNIDPSLGKDHLPINLSVKIAIEKILLIVGDGQPDGPQEQKEETA